MLEYNSSHGKKPKRRRRRIGEMSDRLAKEIQILTKHEIIINSIKTQMRRIWK